MSDPWSQAWLLSFSLQHGRVPRHIHLAPFSCLPDREILRFPCWLEPCLGRTCLRSMAVAPWVRSGSLPLSGVTGDHNLWRATLENWFILKYYSWRWFRQCHREAITLGTHSRSWLRSHFWSSGWCRRFYLTSSHFRMGHCHTQALFPTGSWCWEHPAALGVSLSHILADEDRQRLHQVPAPGRSSTSTSNTTLQGKACFHITLHELRLPLVVRKKCFC
jgi:hypothetical protein